MGKVTIEFTFIFWMNVFLKGAAAIIVIVALIGLMLFGLIHPYFGIPVFFIVCSILVGLLIEA